MYGIDISSWQKGIDLFADECEFVIMKATEGIGMVDNQLYNYVNQLHGSGKLYGFYHFARPDYNGTVEGMQAEAEFFIKTIKSLPMYEYSILVLDWETKPIQRPDLIRAWLMTVEKITGVKPFLYGSASKLKTDGFKSFIYDLGYPVWMAAWPTTSPIYHCKPYPANTYPSTKLPWKIWQFSSNGRGFGFSGAIDCDYTDMTRKEWESMTISGTKGKPVKEDICPEMQWAIEAGIITGRQDGLYYPYDFMTREEVCKILYRYDKYFYEKYMQNQFGHDN